MPVLVPTTLDGALEALADEPGAEILAGGTDTMVAVNDGVSRPSGTVVAVNRVTELRSWTVDPVERTITIGGAVTWSELLDEPFTTLAPALAEAARTVGSPQIRNAGTLGGNLATCSPAGDGLPVLSALDARVELASPAGRRHLSIHDVMTGVKATALEPGELIVSIRLPMIDGWQGFAKVGVRNAMVIAVANACVVLDRGNRRVAVALGSVGPTVVRAEQAESGLSDAIDWSTMDVADHALTTFADQVSRAARPIDDHRSSADYRRHAVGVLARRLVSRGLDRLR